MAVGGGDTIFKKSKPRYGSFLVSGGFIGAADSNSADMARSKNYNMHNQLQNGREIASITLIIRLSFKEVEPKFIRILNFVKKRKKGLKMTETKKN